jgi:hypothetical protein
MLKSATIRTIFLPLTIVLFSLLGINEAKSQCTHSIDLTDTYGDGWNGGTVTVNVNGVPVLTNITFGAGFGPQNFTFSASSGDVITVVRTADGGYPVEMRVEVYDGGGSTIIALQQPPLAPGVNGVGFCSNPDTPCGAGGLITCTTRLLGTNAGMTNSGIAAPSCGSYAGGDCWYSVTVPASGQIQAEAYAGTLSDMAMAVYTVTAGCASTFTEQACDDNSGEGNMPKVTVTGLAAGSTAYMRIWDKNNDQTGNFTIEVRDFGSLFCFTGNAVDLGGGCGQLTSASNGQNGAIWDADDQMDFSGDFTFDFTVNLGTSDAGADGMCFVMHNDPSGLATTGISGNALGAGGITNSLIVEIDTYINTEDRNDGLTGLGCANGPDWDHLDIWTNGTVNPGNCTSGARVIASASELLNGGSLYNIENGNDHILRIAYTSATQLFTATILNAAGTVTYGTVSYTSVDPIVIFGTDTPYFGFTASTGGLNNQQSGCLATAFTSLPIEYLSFDATCTQNQVELNWVTGSEINNDFYSVERSADGIDFAEIARMDGAGNSTQQLYYSWIDYSPLPGQSFYRIKQTDFDGKFDYSLIKSATCGQFEVSIYPNPVEGVLHIKHNSLNFNFEVRNALGQRVPVAVVSSNQTLLELDMSTLMSGVYFITTIENGDVSTEKVMVR